MKVLVKFSLMTHSTKIDLVDYGYDEETKWEDLSEDEQHKITDVLLDEMVIYTNCSTIED